jgi:hypothetical protein
LLLFLLGTRAAAAITVMHNSNAVALESQKYPDANSDGVLSASTSVMSEAITDAGAATPVTMDMQHRCTS